MTDQDDDLFDSVTAMAERIGLSGKDKDRYVHEHMTRGGYRAIPQYVKDDEQDEQDDRGSGFFGSRRTRPNRDRDQDQDRGRGSGRRTRDDDWYTG
jgi:hypothetical protein